jgi:hypothetical protein
MWRDSCTNNSSSNREEVPNSEGRQISRVHVQVHGQASGLFGAFCSVYAGCARTAQLVLRNLLFCCYGLHWQSVY